LYPSVLPHLENQHSLLILVDLGYLADLQHQVFQVPLVLLHLLADPHHLWNLAVLLVLVILLILHHLLVPPVLDFQDYLQDH